MRIHDAVESCQSCSAKDYFSEGARFLRNGVVLGLFSLSFSSFILFI